MNFSYLTADPDDFLTSDHAQIHRFWQQKSNQNSVNPISGHLRKIPYYDRTYPIGYQIRSIRSDQARLTLIQEVYVNNNQYIEFFLKNDLDFQGSCNKKVFIVTSDYFRGYI